MATHKHDLSPTADGGVYCMSRGCELNLDADETAAALQALLEACEAVEWIANCWGNFCPWCDNNQAKGHKADCQRQVAIAQANGEAKP